MARITLVCGLNLQQVVTFVATRRSHHGDKVWIVSRPSQTDSQLMCRKSYPPQNRTVSLHAIGKPLLLLRIEVVAVINRFIAATNENSLHVLSRIVIRALRHRVALWDALFPCLEFKTSLASHLHDGMQHVQLCLDLRREVI